MQFLIGFITAIVSVIILMVAFLLGQRSNKRDKDKSIKVGFEEEEKARQRGMNNVLSYDLDVAIGRREQRE